MFTRLTNPLAFDNMPKFYLIPLLLTLTTCRFLKEFESLFAWLILATRSPILYLGYRKLSWLSMILQILFRFRIFYYLVHYARPNQNLLFVFLTSVFNQSDVTVQ